MSVRRKGNVSAESINRLHSGSGKAGTSKGKRDVVTIGDRVIVQGKQSGIIRFYGNVSVVVSSHVHCRILYSSSGTLPTDQTTASFPAPSYSLLCISLSLSLVEGVNEKEEKGDKK